MPSPNNVVHFLRNPSHFTDREHRKTVLERALTRALSDTTLANGTGKWYKYDEKNNTIVETAESASKLGELGLELDHVFERQFMSALGVHACEDNTSIFELNHLLRLENTRANLVWIPKELHQAKNRIFGKSKDILTENVGLYLEKCAPYFKQEIDQHWTSPQTPDLSDFTLNVVKMIKMTPWYDETWETYARQPWFI